MDEVFQKALEVLGSAEKAKSWLAASNQALGGFSPDGLAQSPEGIQAVLQVLGRIEHGIFN